MYSLSDNGLEFIKSFEGFSAKACKCVSTEKYYTIGYGHYGADVKKTDTITKADALKLLRKDVANFEKAVNNINKAKGQDSFDALVSFAYNCGVGNLNKLCKDRTLSEIASKITLYDKSGGAVLKGLTRRREAEKKMIEKDLVSKPSIKYYKKCSIGVTSIVNGLKEINVDSSYNNRSKIATANGIKNYSGLGSQNLAMLNLLKKGKLIKV